MQLHTTRLVKICGSLGMPKISNKNPTACRHYDMNKKIRRKICYMIGFQLIHFTCK